MAQLGLCYVGFSYILQVYKKEVKIHLSQQKSLRPKSQSIHHSVMATTTVVNVKWINQLVYRHNNASNDQLLPPVKCETWFVKSLITALDLQPTCVFKSIDNITLLPRSFLCKGPNILKISCEYYKAQNYSSLTLFCVNASIHFFHIRIICDRHGNVHLGNYSQDFALYVI